VSGRLRLRHRLAAALGASAFLVLAGTGAGYAAWTASSTLPASTSPAAVGVTLAATPPAPAGSFSSTTPTALVELTIANTGQTPLSLVLTGRAADTPSSHISVRLAPRAGSCPASAPTEATASTTISSITPAAPTPIPLPSGTTSLAAGAQRVICAYLTFASDRFAADAGAVTTVTFAVTGSVGTWSASAGADVVRTVAASAPSACVVTSAVPGYAPWAWNIEYHVTTDGKKNPVYVAYIVARDGVPLATGPVRVPLSNDATSDYAIIQIAAAAFTQDGVYTIEVWRYPSGPAGSHTVSETFTITQSPVGNFADHPIVCGFAP